MGSSLHTGERGFTLIEMLVVLLTMAILATIGFSIFLNQRAKAQDAEAKTSASLVASTMQVYHQDNETFVGADRDALILIEPAIAAVRGLVLDTDVDSFEISVESASDTSGGGPFVVAYEAGATDRSCVVPGRGGCPRTGVW